MNNKTLGSMSKDNRLRDALFLNTGLILGTDASRTKELGYNIDNLGRLRDKNWKLIDDKKAGEIWHGIITLKEPLDCPFVDVNFTLPDDIELLPIIMSELDVEYGQWWWGEDSSSYKILESGDLMAMVGIDGESVVANYLWGEIFSGLIRPVKTPPLMCRYAYPSNNPNNRWGINFWIGSDKDYRRLEKGWACHSITQAVDKIEERRVWSKGKTLEERRSI